MSTDGNTSASSIGGPAANPTADATATAAAASSSNSITAAARPSLIARPPLDVYKKIAIIRRETDEVVYQDAATGGLRKIADLAKASTSTVSPFFVRSSFGDIS